MSNINIKRTPEQVALVKQLGSKNKVESMAAQEAFAAFISDVLLQVVEAAPVISNLYTTKSYAEGTSPSLPLDVMFDIRDAGYLQVWTQTIAGGLPTNFVHGLDELMVSVYSLDSAVSMGKKYARNARLDVVAAVLERLAQEILIKQETNGASILLKASADARQQGTTSPQIIKTATANVFTLDDLNRLITLAARSRPSWVGSTPVTNNAITDLIGSPEFMEQIRSIAYQPVNTRVTTAGAGAATYLAGGVIAAPESVRESVWNTAGVPNFFGINLTQVYNYGVGRSYNSLFGNFIGSTQFDGSSTFTASSDEVITALNLNSPNVLVRLVQEGEGGGRLEVLPDDSFPARVDKLGFSASLVEGRVMLDQRAVVSAVM
jgi:hypothetical protein